MACYDCEDCGYGNSGKCERWEYNCPFKHLPEGKDKDLDGIAKKELEAAKKLQIELKLLYDKYSGIIKWYTEEYGMDLLKESLEELSNSLDDDLIKEWDTIVNGGDTK